MDFIKLEKSAFDGIMELLSFKDLKCSFCDEKLTKNNFGLISKDIFSCSNILCLVQAINKIEEKTNNKVCSEEDVGVCVNCQEELNSEKKVSICLSCWQEIKNEWNERVKDRVR